MTATTAAFTLYLAALFVLALAAWRKTRNETDYVLGGRSLGPAVAALSAGASDMSGWLLLGLPGAVFLGGLTESWIMIGLMLGAYLNWRFVAARLREATGTGDGQGGALTLPAFFAQRAEGSPRSRRAVRALATILILFFFTFYVSAGLVAGARLFESTLGLSYLTALLLGAGVIVAYTTAGGFLAVAWTDFFQGLLMLGALLLVPALALLAPANAPLPAGHLELFSGLTLMGWLSLVAWGLGYVGQPHILARFMALRRASEARQATRIGMGWMILSGLGAVALGLLGPRLLPDLADPETVFIALTQSLLAPAFAGVILAAILAAVMSTIDSQLLVASTALAEDVFAVLRPTASARARLNVGRGAVLLVAATALALAQDPNSKVLSLVSYAWAGLGASFGPAVLYALYGKGFSARGAFWGMVAGGGTVVLWGQLKWGIFDLYEILPGFAFSFLVLHALRNREA